MPSVGHEPDLSQQNVPGVPVISSGPLRCLEGKRHRRVKRHRVTAHGCIFDSIGLESPPRDLYAAVYIGALGVASGTTSISSRVM